MARRLARVVYSNTTTIRDTFAAFETISQIDTFLQGMPALVGPTYTAQALDTVTNQLLSTSAVNGYRHGRVAVVLFSISSSLDNLASLQASAAALQAKAEVFVLGIGPSVNVTQMNAIASQPTASHVVTLSIAQLMSFANVTDVAAVTSCNTTASAQGKPARRSLANDVHLPASTPAPGHAAGLVVAAALLTTALLLAALLHRTLTPDSRQ